CTVAPDTQLPAVLRAGGDLQRHAVPVRRRHLDGRAERSLGVGDGNVDDEIRASTIEPLRGLDPRHDEQIARRPARLADLTFALEADARTVLDARRNLDRVAARAPFAAAALAFAARLLHDRAVAAATRAGLRQREQTLALRDDAAAVALRTDHRRRPGLCPGAAALAACGRHLDGNLGLEPAQRILEGEIDDRLDVRTALGLRPSRPRPSAVDHPAEQTPEISEVVARAVASAAHDVAR